MGGSAADTAAADPADPATTVLLLLSSLADVQAVLEDDPANVDALKVRWW
jgi:hypothetical protein